MKRSTSINRLFILIFTFVLILPMIGVVCFFLIAVYDSNRDRVANDLQTISYTLSTKVNTRLEAPARYLMTVADSLLYNQDDSRVEEILQSGMANFIILDALYILDEEMVIKNISYGNMSKYAREDFIGIKLNSVKAFTDKSLYWSRPFRSLVTNNYVVRVSVKYNGGYIIGDLNLKFLTLDFSRTSRLDELDIFIVDDRGDIVSVSHEGLKVKYDNLFNHPVVTESYKGNHLVSGYMYDGETKIGAGYKLPSSGWYMVVEQSEREAYKYFKDVYKVTLITAILGLLFIFVVLIFIRKKLINPIKTLTDRSEHLSRGEHVTFSSEEKDVFSELRTLYDSFENMSDRIIKREKALREKEEYVRSVFDSTTNTGIIVISSEDDSTISDANVGAQRISGYKLSEMIGMHPAALVSGGDELDRLKREAVARSGMTSANFDMMKKNGIHFPVMCTVHPMIKPNEDITDLIVVFVDITEVTRVQKALESEKERLDVTLRSIGEGVMAADRDGRVTLMNSIAETVLAQKYRYIIGHNISDILQIYDHETGEDLSGELTKVNDKSRKSFRANIVSKHAGIVTVNLTSSAMLDNKGEIIGFVYVFRDITDRIRIDQELVNRKVQLEEINRNLEKRINDEANKRRKNEQMLFEQAKFAAMGQMISAIAHQWRQPLNALALYTQDIEDAYEAGEVDAKFLKNFVGTSMNLINHMSVTIDDFRNFFHSNNVQERVNIVDVLSDSMALISTQLRNQSISYKIEIHYNNTIEEFLDRLPEPGRAYGRDVFISSSEMKQVMLNILQNARDAIAEQRAELAKIAGNINLKVVFEETRVVIEISNDGGNIPEDSLISIFDPYYTTKPEGEGTGIGLYMSKVMVEEHMDGLLKADNIKGGAKFTIILYYN